ncbi:Dyp-type peroxidase [Actinotalea sp. M2MS4P-6]|uniref:Dyp-type peroxidase n=1 Tax=Actinotalea sp. M2MS4P-6 TaxID=2983762 RepID=UPI0021E35E17|nr:Dyp-type peroxidase [Actinotalea sp. M2MS4P-6]MCV2396297.1 Dyp-type peroxidase [Actinotalea sp. M2MS4P-6]
MTVDRRTFLQGGAVAVGGAALALGGRTVWDHTVAPQPADDAVGTATESFRGARQAGVSTAPQAFAAWTAFDLLPGTDRDALVRLMRIWTDDIERLMGGRPPLADTEPELATAPARLTVTLGLGEGFFTAAGAEDRRPSWLAPLPDLAVDHLQEGWSGGDLVLQVAADDLMAVTHALRVLTKGATTFVVPRWTQRGFREAVGTRPSGTTMRNLMGQVDGTANPDPVLQPDLVWFGSDAEPWLVGATSMVVRRIAMDLDGWDKVDRTGREFTIGRRLDNGAPLTGTDEHDAPDLTATDALGLPVIDTAAHIRRAAASGPRERFLRRPYSFDDPDQPAAERSGLVFVTFQRDVVEQFLPVQRRLAEMDLLNQWTTPIGSAVFLVPPGPGPGEHLAQSIFA